MCKVQVRISNTGLFLFIPIQMKYNTNLYGSMFSLQKLHTQLGQTTINDFQIYILAGAVSYEIITDNL